MEAAQPYGIGDAPPEHPRTITMARGEDGRMHPADPLATDPRPALPPPDRWPHAMVDIETMSTHSSRALILSIGVVPFELLAAGPRFGADALLLLPDLAEQLADGRVVDPKTQAWWRDQKPAARAHFLDPDFGARVEDPAVPQRCSLEQAARKLNVFLTAETLPDAGLWANGAVFDIGNLENLLHGAGIQPAWRYNSVRDYRTVSKILPRVRTRMGAETFTAHDPVSDCRLQIWRLWEHAPDSLLADGPEAKVAAMYEAAAPTHAVRQGVCSLCGGDHKGGACMPPVPSQRYTGPRMMG